MCDHCNERDFSEGWQIREKWICPRCKDQFTLDTEKKYGNEWNPERLDEIYKMIK